jgi:hypothetical protein
LIFLQICTQFRLPLDLNLYRGMCKHNVYNWLYVNIVFLHVLNNLTFFKVIPLTDLLLWQMLVSLGIVIFTERYYECPNNEHPLISRRVMHGTFWHLFIVLSTIINTNCLCYTNHQKFIHLSIIKWQCNLNSDQVKRMAILRTALE